MKVLVTGGTGHLGRVVVAGLSERDHQVRVLARRLGDDADMEWVQGDLATAAGVEEAVAGVDAIIHAATNSPAAQRGGFTLLDFVRSPKDVDIDGTTALLAAAQREGVQHFVHVSIVGLRHMARINPYARVKLAAEDIVRESACRWSIVRGTGFYWLLDRMLTRMARRRTLWLPDEVRMQPVDSDEFAACTSPESSTTAGRGERPDFVGPRALTMRRLAEQFLAARGLERRIRSAPIPRRAKRALDAGNTSATGVRGHVHMGGVARNPSGDPRSARQRARSCGVTELRMDDDFNALRPAMFGLAYRMLGSVSEAEDIVQEAFLRQQRAVRDGVEIDSPRAYLSTVVTRLSIDHLRSARVRREVYIGEWLPEPILTDDDPNLDPARHSEHADSLSLAFLVLLEQLNPVERAVFLLRDVFGYGYDELAGILGKSEENCRQLASRARRHIDGQKPRFEASRQERERLAARFFAAVGDGDVDALAEMLAADVVVYGDGGGKGPSWPQPIVGRNRVSRLFAGLGPDVIALGIRIELREVNGQPGAMMLDPAGRIVNVFSLDITAGVVQTIRSVINPDKLRHLGPLADVRALVRRRSVGG